jgi:hypothetical protein
MGLKEFMKKGDAEMAKFKAHVEADAAAKRMGAPASAPLAEGDVRAAARESLSQ